MRKNDLKTKNDDYSYEEQIVNNVLEDFKNRQAERRSFELQWQLNMNFLMGNQYCQIGPSGEIEDEDKDYYWQQREVYNHIAPIIDARLSKLSNMKPSMTVVPASGDERDIKTAKVSKKIVNSIYNKLAVSGMINQANKWSEVCGTSFYKVTWNSAKGSLIGKNDLGKAISSGDVEITVCPPFEIYPESSSCADINDCKSIIHARAYHIEDIKNIWGVEVEGSDVNVFSLDNSNISDTFGFFGENKRYINGTRKDYAIVIERYEAPTVEFPNGKLTIIAGNKLVYLGDLPYINGNEGERCFPFIKQTSIEQPGLFWGVSIIERLIPIQKSYNTIKNRKHEFMNRLSMGVLTVEDGSIDTENLEDEGLSPGKVIVYRQGANPPSFMSFDKIPVDFSSEEISLLEEFTTVSGVSDLMTNSVTKYANLSGTALQRLIEQDDSRIACTAESLKEAIKTMGKHVLRLYRQFASIPRLSKIVGDNGDIEVFYFNSSDISSDDIVFETENEIGETTAQKRAMVFDLINAGLLQDENGKLSNRMRVKALELLGFGVWENAQDINELHLKRAASENLKMIESGETISPLEVDEHDIHITEHTAFLLGGEFEKKAQKNSRLTEVILSHIRMHKQLKNLNKQIEEK